MNHGLINKRGYGLEKNKPRRADRVKYKARARGLESHNKPKFLNAREVDGKPKGDPFRLIWPYTIFLNF